MIFEGYSVSGRCGWTYGSFPGPGHVISNISENFYFSKISESQILPTDLLEKGEILEASLYFRCSKGFNRKLTKPRSELHLKSYTQNAEISWTKVNNIVKIV